MTENERKIEIARLADFYDPTRCDEHFIAAILHTAVATGDRRPLTEIGEQLVEELMQGDFLDRFPGLDGAVCRLTGASPVTVTEIGGRCDCGQALAPGETLVCGACDDFLRLESKQG